MAIVKISISMPEETLDEIDQIVGAGKEFATRSHMFTRLFELWKQQQLTPIDFMQPPAESPADFMRRHGVPYLPGIEETS